MPCAGRIRASITPGGSIRATLARGQTIGASICKATAESAPAYGGTYTVTPTQRTQTLPTEGMLLSDNITINPIPSNYGLITYNGSVLTVS